MKLCVSIVCEGNSQFLYNVLASLNGPTDCRPSQPQFSSHLRSSHTQFPHRPVSRNTSYLNTFRFFTRSSDPLLRHVKYLQNPCDNRIKTETLSSQAILALHLSGRGKNRVNKFVSFRQTRVSEEILGKACPIAMARSQNPAAGPVFGQGLNENKTMLGRVQKLQFASPR